MSGNLQRGRVGENPTLSFFCIFAATAARENLTIRGEALMYVIRTIPQQLDFVSLKLGFLPLLMYVICTLSEIYDFII